MSCVFLRTGGLAVDRCMKMCRVSGRGKQSDFIQYILKDKLNCPPVCCPRRMRWAGRIYYRSPFVRVIVSAVTRAEYFSKRDRWCFLEKRSLQQHESGRGVPDREGPVWHTVTRAAPGLRATVELCRSSRAPAVLRLTGPLQIAAVSWTSSYLEICVGEGFRYLCEIPSTLRCWMPTCVCTHEGNQIKWYYITIRFFFFFF